MSVAKLGRRGPQMMETQVNLDSTSDGLVRLTYQADDTTPTSESKTTHHTPASIGPSPLRVVDQT
ncbi:hypothetical protein CYMTET_40421, partial [Cymbomonas tetramitiformis]